MFRTKRTLSLFTAVAALTLWACSGDGTATSPSQTIVTAGAEKATLSSANREPVVVLRRQSRMPTRSESGVIGPAGGEIRLSQAGLTVIFPPGAVAHRTRITVTATAGIYVAYDFAPHGLQFAVPVILEQDLRETMATRHSEILSMLQGDYYEGPLDDLIITDPHRKRAHSSEHRGGGVEFSSKTFRFTIEHFSGYLVSTGRAGEELEDEVRDAAGGIGIITDTTKR